MALDLASLQDRMATFPTAEARAEIELSLGRPIEELYVEFAEPVAAASIAQVHPAVILRGGREEAVAVKVIRPACESASFTIWRVTFWPRACRSASCHLRAA